MADYNPPTPSRTRGAAVSSFETAASTPSSRVETPSPCLSSRGENKNKNKQNLNAENRKRIKRKRKRLSLRLISII